MPGINDLYRYIDEMTAINRKAVMDGRPAPELTSMFTELKTMIHTLRCNDCGRRNGNS